MMSQDKIKARARNNAYALLRQRPRSIYEIKSRLKLKGYDEALIKDVVVSLERAGELDDDRFARLWVESRMRMNPAGDVVLKHELKAKGVSDRIIEAVLAEKSEKYDEYEIALSMAKDRFERLKKLDRRKATKRIYDFLLRRGFAYDNVRKIVENLTRLN